MLNSPMLEFFARNDEQYKMIYENDFYELNKKQKPDSMYQLILAHVQFLADNQDCIVTETFGDLGAGKSLGTTDFLIRVGQIYGVAFGPKDVLYDRFIVNDELRKKGNRSTTMVDESTKGYGELSKTVEIQLLEFRDQGRITQKNIGWISPDFRQDSRGLAFEADKLGMERKSNPLCNDCPIYRQCKAHFFETLCTNPQTLTNLKQNIPIEKPVLPWERSGYPIRFRFNVYYPHRYERKPIYRGHILIPMVDFETAKAYDIVKQKNIKRMQQYESPKEKIIDDIALKIIKSEAKLLVKKHGVWKMTKQARIEMLVSLSPHAASLTAGVKKNLLKEKVLMFLEDIINEKNKDELGAITDDDEDDDDADESG